MKILAVEDDAVSRAVLRKALHRLNHDVIEAADGEQAWEKLQTEPVRVVVSDWMMPRSDGLDLCRRIRAGRGKDYTYFILLTSRDATEENQRVAADAGLDDFLTKPLDLPERWTRLRAAERILVYTTQVRQLEELRAIRSCCKKIRDDQNHWQQREGYINERTGSEFSHSVWPDCYTSVMVPQLEEIKAATAPRTSPSVERSH